MSREPASELPERDEHRPLEWRSLDPTNRWLWFEWIWFSVCELRRRYELPVRSGWWEHELVVELLAALAAWVERYDNDEWDDPPGKLALLYDLERIRPLLRDGSEPFDPERDGAAFTAHMLALGCESPDGRASDDYGEYDDDQGTTTRP